MNVCVDFDDLCDNVQHELDAVQALHEQHPTIKITLFAIPKRCSAKLIQRAKALGDWIQLAPHGWRHTRGECFGWTVDEAIAKITAARDMGIDAPCFRAPGWLLDQDTYTACKELGYTVCSHEVFRVFNTGVSEYVYNIYKPKFTAVHGHLTPVTNNHISTCVVPVGNYVFPQDIACVS